MANNKRDFNADRAIISEATAGPWVYDESRNDAYEPVDCEAIDFNLPQNVRFIAEARSGWPAALDEIARLREENDKLHAVRDALLSAHKRRGAIMTAMCGDDEAVVLAREVGEDDGNGKETAAAEHLASLMAEWKPYANRAEYVYRGEEDKNDANATEEEKHGPEGAD